LAGMLTRCGSQMSNVGESYTVSSRALVSIIQRHVLAYLFESGMLFALKLFRTSWVVSATGVYGETV
jgi:hypothetical protein